MCFLMGKEDVSFDLIARSVEHHFDGISSTYGRHTVHLRELGSGHKPFDLATDVDDDFLLRNLQDMALKYLPITRRELVAVSLKKGLIVARIRGWQFQGFVLWTFHANSRSHLASTRAECVQKSEQ